MTQIVSYIQIDEQAGQALHRHRGTEGRHHARFAEAEGMAVVAEHAEAGTGKDVDALDRRPKLAAALAQARKASAPVVVAKLDGLSQE